MTNTRLEAELLQEGEKRIEADEAVADLHAKRKLLDAAVKKAEQRAVDVENGHESTLKKLHQLIEQRVNLDVLTDFLRRRSNEVMRGQERHGQRGAEKPQADDDDDDKELVRETLRQRDKMQTTVSQLSNELQRDKQKARFQVNLLATEAQRAHENMNEVLVKNQQLKQELTVTSERVRELEAALSKPSRSSARLLPPPGNTPTRSKQPVSALTGSGAGGLVHSATAHELGRLPQSVDHEARPTSAPGINTPLASPLAAAPAAELKATLTEQMEQQLLENQHLRQSLLYFTSKASSKGKKSAVASKMPLPPV